MQPGKFGCKVARGGASRLGLKQSSLARPQSQHQGGSWRGFPPGIETLPVAQHSGCRKRVARGGASRLGLKHLRAIDQQTTMHGGSWRGFPPGIETAIPDGVAGFVKPWLVEGLPAWD